MADWVWVESPGTTLTEKARLRVAQFGDGYRQAAPDGINHVSQEWQYTANDVDDAIAADMVAFLRAHQDGEPFSYVPLWATTAILVTCDGDWSRSLGNAIGTSSIRATFKQWFGALA